MFSTFFQEFCERKGIDYPEEEDGRGLLNVAISLALELNPRLIRSKKPPGAKPSAQGRDFELYVNVEFAKAQGVKQADTIRTLTKRGGIFEGQSPNYLRQRLSVLRKPGPERDRLLTNILIAARAWEESG